MIDDAAARGVRLVLLRPSIVVVSLLSITGLLEHFGVH
jgi:hypothetical protein